MKIKHFPCQPHCFAYGGFDIQMNRVIDLLVLKGIDVERINLWDRNCNFQIAHFWGAEESHKLAMRFCKSSNIKIIISALFPPMTRKGLIIQKLKSNFLKLLGVTRSYNLADTLIVINEDQANFANNILGIDKSKITVINTILDDDFFQLNCIEESNLEIEKFCLCVGTICKRKNQISLMSAALVIGCKVVFVGKFDNGEIEYIDKFNEILNSRPDLFTHFTDVTSFELKSLYRKCSLVSCISHVETEPASILEGMIFKKPIIAANRPFAKTKKFNGVILCNPVSIVSIVDAIEMAFKIKTKEYINFELNSYHSSEVIPKYIQLYTSVALLLK